MLFILFAAVLMFTIFFITTIITTTSDIQPNYSCKRFSTFNGDIIRFTDWLRENNCNDVYMESIGKY